MIILVFLGPATQSAAVVNTFMYTSTSPPQHLCPTVTYENDRTVSRLTFPATENHDKQKVMCTAKNEKFPRTSDQRSDSWELNVMCELPNFVCVKNQRQFCVHIFFCIVEEITSYWNFNRPIINCDILSNNIFATVKILIELIFTVYLKEFKHFIYGILLIICY